MTARDAEGWWRSLLRAAVELWAGYVTLKSLERDGDGGMSWWSTVRRLAAFLAYRFGRLAIYAENRYNQARP